MGLGEVITMGFVMGAVGSFHCIGMCGPLALALPLTQPGTRGRLAGSLIYNAGRIVTYTLLGLVLGCAGEYVFAAKYQNGLSIGLGLVILIYLFTPKKIRTSTYLTKLSNKLFLKLRTALGKLLTSRKSASLFSIGMLNGLLPCGMIYLAITSSFMTGTAVKGSLFMLCFGLGTFPIMFSVVFFSSTFSQQLRFKIRMAIPLFLCVMAVLLVLRGLNLGIPYISPYLSSHGSHAIPCH